METKSIWTLFKRELGYTTASIQYVELSRRIADDTQGGILKGNSIRDAARQYGLSVSELPEDFGMRIAKSYIIQVHSCVERFLEDFHHLIGSPTYALEYDREKDNLLHWTIQNALSSTETSKEYNQVYRICDYYRYVRNDIIHFGAAKSGLRQSYGALSGFRDETLNAPNMIDSICFDDQVLFARSARTILEAIYFESQYDWPLIIEKNRTELRRITQKCLDKPEKTTQKVQNYLRQSYPIPQAGIPDLLELL